jgi:hypothetical protein
LEHVLTLTSGKIHGRSGAAEGLGINTVFLKPNCDAALHCQAE